MVFKVLDQKFGLFGGILMNFIEFLLEIKGFLMGLFANQAVIDLIFAKEFFYFFLVEIVFPLSKRKIELRILGVERNLIGKELHRFLSLSNIKYHI